MKVMTKKTQKYLRNNAHARDAPLDAEIVLHDAPEFHDVLE